MSITYDLIIKTLCSEKEINPFITKKNMIKYSSDFISFKDIFDETFYRYGNESKLSLWISILFIIKDNFFTISSDDINSEAKYMHKNIINLDSLCEQIKINIIVFDFKNNDMKYHYHGEYFNPWIDTIFLAKYDDLWEPICCNDTKMFSYVSPKVNIFKNKILNKLIENNDFVLNDNIDYICENTLEYVESSINDNIPFTTQNNIHQNLSKSKLNKMKKDEIIQLIDDLNLNITKLKPTKNDLISVILNN